MLAEPEVSTLYINPPYRLKLSFGRVVLDVRPRPELVNVKRLDRPEAEIDPILTKFTSTD